MRFIGRYVGLDVEADIPRPHSIGQFGRVTAIGKTAASVLSLAIGYIWTAHSRHLIHTLDAAVARRMADIHCECEIKVLPDDSYADKADLSRHFVKVCFSNSGPYARSNLNGTANG